MIRYFTHRIFFGFIPVAIAVVTIVALLIQFIPGDPVDAMLGPNASLQDKITLKTQLGLDQPAFFRIIHYFKNILHGDLGNSLLQGRPVLDLIAERLPATISLALCALIVTMIISIPLGIIASIKKGTIIDKATMSFAVLGICVPNFWLGPMLVLVFALNLDLFPVSEKNGLISYVLPSITMGIALSAILSRMTRNAMLEVLKEDFIRTARAKGLSEWTVVLKHALRNASLPLITIIGLQFGVLLTGAIITENIFDWPGIGSLILEGINNRDYPLVQGCVLTFAFSYMLVNLLTDITYGLADPRIRVDI